MPFPAKTGRAAILTAAVDQVARGGADALSVRSLAASLALAPNALYRYFPSRANLEIAVAAEITERIRAALAAAVGRKEPEPALRALAHAYVAFAREQPGLYQAFMACPVSSPEAVEAHGKLWEFVVEQVSRLTGTREVLEATTSLWALLHGFVSLETLCALQHGEATPSLEYGLRSWLNHAARDRA